MMDLSRIDMLAALAAVAGVGMCGLLSLRTMLWGLAAQTALLGVVVFLHGQEVHAAHYLLLAGVVITVKAAAIPLFLGWITRKIEVLRDKGTGLNPCLALFVGCAALAAGYSLSPWVKGPISHNPGAAGMALALLLIGMLLMLTRRLAISQIIGFLVLENGIFLYALTQTSGMPLMVEMGVVFDVLVGVMVAGLVIFRLNRSFEHIDVTKLTGLKR
jgi:hydrogenase-4 component E